MKLVKEAQGQLISRGGKASADINMSSIWTELIKEAAKCDSYSADVLIDIDTAREKLASGKPEDFTCYFGFRDNGVDHEAFIRNRKSEGYRRILSLSITYEKYGDTGYEKCYWISAKLAEIDQLPEISENPA